MDVIMMPKVAKIEPGVNNFHLLFMETPIQIAC